MHRLLAEVRDKTLKKRYRARNGLEHGRYSLRVKVLGTAIDALSVPDGVAGRETVVTRAFLLPWAPRKGDLLTLDPDESARILRPRRAALHDGPSPGAGVSADFVDSDRDGYPEDVVSNRFVRAVLQPHRGARLSSLTGPDGEDRFAHPYEYIMAGKYVLLGGVEPVIAEAGSPGEIWKSAFERTVADGSADAFEATYTRKLESPRGVVLTKTTRIEDDFPGVLETYRVKYSGKPGGPGGGRPPGGGGGSDARDDARGRRGDGKKDETEVTFGLRASTATPGETPSLNVFELSCADGVRTVRFHPPGFGRRWRWRDWRDEHFCLRGGFLVSRNERLGNVLAVLVNGRRAHYVSVRSDYTGPEVAVVHGTRKLAKGRSVTLGAAFLAGDAVAVGRGSMFLASLGARRGGKRPLALTLRTTADVGGSVRARVSSPEGARTVALRRRSLPEVGDVHTGILELGGESLPVSAGVGAGRERLSVRLEG
ncbi:MAG: hypothetical protein ABIG03_02950 [Candidatus Eisenbacteria bacterium]